MLEVYLPISLFVAIGLFIGLFPMGLGWLLGAKKGYFAKESPYECGFNPFGDARLPMDIRYYLIAILFIVFDLELAFLVPWAVIFKTVSNEGFLVGGLFFVILLLGFLYEWSEGALEWE